MEALGIFWQKKLKKDLIFIFQCYIITWCQETDNKIWRCRLAWSRAHDWKSCRGQKLLESSNLSISAKTVSEDNALETVFLL